ncbi:MAG: hypothetical protein IPI17_07290 [Nitrosomonas sp.]|nr:hypothetical protein [Nitrosomonas sp.]
MMTSFLLVKGLRIAMMYQGVNVEGLEAYKGLSKFIEENLDPKDQGRVRYITSESIVEHLDSFGKPAPTEQVVRGYKVRTVQQSVDSEDAASRRKAISEVIARSLKKRKKDKD